MADLSTLRIYKIAVEIGEEAWLVVSAWDKFEKWTIGKQLSDAADSVAAAKLLPVANKYRQIQQKPRNPAKREHPGLSEGRLPGTDIPTQGFKRRKRGNSLQK